MATTGLKTKFMREGATAETFEAVASVASIQPPQYQRNMTEVDELDPADELIQRVHGLVDAGEISVTLNFDPDSTAQTALEEDFWTAAVKKYQIKLPNGKGWTMSAIVSGWAPQEIAPEDVIQIEVTLTVKSKPTFGAIV